MLTCVGGATYIALLHLFCLLKKLCCCLAIYTDEAFHNTQAVSSAYFQCSRLLSSFLIARARLQIFVSSHDVASAILTDLQSKLPRFSTGLQMHRELRECCKDAQYEQVPSADISCEHQALLQSPPRAC